MSYTEIIKLIKDTNLPFSEEKYNGSREIQVSLTEEGTAQKYMKEDCDYIEISYIYPKNENSSNDELDKYTFGTCVYVPSDSSIELINHESGDYFSYSEPGNYISNLGNAIDIDKNISKEEQLNYYFLHK